MAKTKGTTKRTVIVPTKVTPIWQIGILFPDGKKIVKKKCTLNEVLETYFLSLDKHLDKGYESEQLWNLYQDNYRNKNIKVAINYIDSWGHKWSGKVAWPKKCKFIEYLDKIILNNKYND